MRLSKGDSTFCYPEYIGREMVRVFASLKSAKVLRGRTRKAFAAGAAHFLAELNAVHAFREGNGRVQNTFLAMLAAAAGHPLDLDRLDPDALLAAMIASFHGNERPLSAVLLDMMS